MLNTTLDQRPADHAGEIERNAYNVAFTELGLPWYWDIGTHRDLQANAEERERVRIYLETQQTHLLKAYEADFLINAIQTTKARCYNAMTAGSA